MQVLASQLAFLANRNAELAVPPLFWPVNCIKIKGHVALLSGPTVYTLYCGYSIKSERKQMRAVTTGNMNSWFSKIITQSILYYENNGNNTLL